MKHLDPDDGPMTYVERPGTDELGVWRRAPSIGLAPTEDVIGNVLYAAALLAARATARGSRRVRRQTPSEAEEQLARAVARRSAKDAKRRPAAPIPERDENERRET